MSFQHFLCSLSHLSNYNAIVSFSFFFQICKRLQMEAVGSAAIPFLIQL